MSKYQLPDCARSCVKSGEDCEEKGCRMWVDYEDDQNCSLVSIYHNGSMTLDEVSKRLKISLVRVSQIEKQAIMKLSKRIKI